MRTKAGNEILKLIVQELRMEENQFKFWMQNGGSKKFNELPEFVQAMIVRGVIDTKEQIFKYEELMR